MAFGLKGVARDWGPGLVTISGSFTVSGTTVALSRPSRPGFTIVRKAVGVYQVSLSQAFLSVAAATARVGPATGLGTASVATSFPVDAMITEDFFTANSTPQWVVDATNKNLVISTFTGGSLTELTANYRCAFIIKLCESAVNK